MTLLYLWERVKFVVHSGIDSHVVGLRSVCSDFPQPAGFVHTLSDMETFRSVLASSHAHFNREAELYRALIAVTWETALVSNRLLSP